MQNLLLSEPGLTSGESTEILEATEAMEVDPLMMLMAEMAHLPMDTGQSGVPLGAFQLELTELGYTPSLIGSMDTPPSPITAADNALLDLTDPKIQNRRHPKPQGLEDQRVHRMRDPLRNPEWLSRKGSHPPPESNQQDHPLEGNYYSGHKLFLLMWFLYFIKVFYRKCSYWIGQYYILEDRNSDFYSNCYLNVLVLVLDSGCRLMVPIVTPSTACFS